MKRVAHGGFKEPPYEKRPFLITTPYYTYILRSESTNKHYCGCTSDVQRRLRQHNDPEYKLINTTKRFAGPSELMRQEEFVTRSEAMGKEKQIKKRGIKRYVEDCAQSVSSL
jgi:putative endonuclease